jgi:hypothetical protein
VLMFRCEIEDNRPLACLTQQVNPHKIMNHPARPRMLNPFPLWVGKRRIMVFEPTFRTSDLTLGIFLCFLF